MPDEYMSFYRNFGRMVFPLPHNFFWISEIKNTILNVSTKLRLCAAGTSLNTGRLNPTITG